MITVPLLKAETDAKITSEDVHQEVVRISERLGRDFRHFLKERNGNIYFEAAEGNLHPTKWVFIPRYGTREAFGDSPAAFALFFLTITGMPLAKHHVEWADFAWECFDDKVGAIIEAFRGSGKSIFTRILMAYLIGLYPEKSSLIIRSADAAARKTADAIANIIANHKAWQLWFPSVKPKSSPGQAGGEWSANSGYSVIDYSRDPDEWKAIEAGRTSPTLTKFGLGSKSVLGSRVTLIMLADDLHDDENAQAMLEYMVVRFQEIVEKCRTPESRLMIIGTPWDLQDLLQVLPQTGEYRKVKTAVTTESTYPGTPTWPECYTAEWIDKEYNKDTQPGKRAFKRQQLLDLQAQIAVQLAWSEFKYRQIKQEDKIAWPVRIGVDFAELENTASGRGRSYFSASVTTQDPKSGTWIIIDGMLGQMTADQSETATDFLIEKYKNRIELMCIEAIGGGSVYAQYTIRRHKDVRIVAETGDGTSKEERWERMLAPNFGTRRILVSDDPEIPFLTSVRTALSIYPNIAKRGDWAADVLDSLVWAHWHAFLETGDPVRRKKKVEKKANPWSNLSKM